MHHPTEDEERWLADALERFALNRDPHLRDQIVEATMWIATRSARRFADRGEPFDDLVQVARLGLIKAVDRFDPAHGVHFGAYATPTILGELRRHFRDHTWSVHVSRRAKDLRPAVNEANDELTRDLGRSPTVAEVAARVHATEDAVLEALEANNAYRTRSLDAAQDSPWTPVVDADYSGVLDRRVISDLMDRLAPRERTIIHLRFFEELSQAQIAQRIGTSQVHVGRLLAATLTQLRSHLDRDGAT
jgi:RNA polymerase sigma-B factor